MKVLSNKLLDNQLLDRKIYVHQVIIDELKEFFNKVQIFILLKWFLIYNSQFIYYNQDIS